MSHFVIPNHTVVGTNVLSEAAPLLKKMGNKAFIVTGRHVAVSDMMKQLTALLDENGIDCVIFDGITGEPTDTMIENGVEMLKSSGCDFIIGIGGGSPLDSAKAIAAMAVNEGSIADYNGKEITGEILPLAAIPTTAGTGSEATKFTVITDSEKGIKMLLKGDVLVPKLAIVDSSFTVGTPKSVTSATGLDALTHAVEAYTSRKAFSMTDTLAVSAVKRIMKYLPIAYKEPDNSLAREQMSIAALEAGICINNSSVTIVHGMSRPIGALFHIPHGMSNAMLLKECLSFAVSGAYEKFANLGRETGVANDSDSDETAAEKFIDSLQNICDVCEIPTLEQYGIDRDEYYSKISKMATDAVASGSPANTVKEVTVDDCIEIYKKLYV
ncbi:iron-containing alcohol dehydrogenase [Ruminococcus bromii]|uniref:NAD-dependent methanol dehydrogenase n=1 Tax=Ruminococcus bromii TaxID=40518 RepID=A0A2N0UI03_9FIRM|nr:iron-containing alcohol dehydrogenase [Ruminococcus bromii]PKD26614.1 NAD-dependent methanol dehydrogenase [Ruminococcus bromii]